MPQFEEKQCRPALMRFLLGVPLLLMSGCAVTVKKFRETPLMVLAKVSEKHEALANCVMLRLEEMTDTGPDTFRITTEGSHTSLFISRSPSGPVRVTPSPLVEIAFTETQRNDLLIESRSLSALNAEYYVDKAKPLIANCGKQSWPISSSGRRPIQLMIPEPNVYTDFLCVLH